MRITHAATLLSLAALAGLGLWFVQRQRSRAGVNRAPGQTDDPASLTSPFLPIGNADVVEQEDILDGRILPPSPLEPMGWFGQPASGAMDTSIFEVEPEYSVVYDMNGRPVDHQAVSWYTVPVTDENAGMLKYPGFLAKVLGQGVTATLLSAQNDVQQVGDGYQDGGMPAYVSGF